MSGGNRLPAKYMAALEEMERFVREPGEIGELLDQSASLIAATLSVEFCNILELLPDRRSLLLRAGVGWEDGLVGQALVPASSETYAGFALISKTPVVVEDFHAETRFQPSILHGHGATSGVSVVIPGWDSFGVLGVHTGARRSFSDNEVSFLESAAETLSRAIHRHRVYQSEALSLAQRRKERDLRLARFTLDHAQEAIFWANADGRLTDVNYGAAEMLGYTPDELLQMGVWDVDRAISAEGWPGNWETLRRRGFVTQESSFRGRDGRLIPVDLTVNYLEFHGEEYACTIGRDVSERSRAREALRQSEEHFRALIENALDLITIIDSNGTVGYVSPSIERVLGYDPQERLGRSTFEIIHPDDLPAVKDALAVVTRAPNATAGLAFRARHKDGSWRYLEAIARNLLANPDVAGVVVNSRDITARRNAEEALRQSEQRFRLAAESASDFIYEWDVNSGRLDWHGDVDACLGYRRGRFPRTIEAWKESLHPDDRERVWRAVDGVLQGAISPPIFEYRIRTRKGRYRHWVARGSCLRDESGEVRRWIGACSDITQRKQTEQALRQSEAELRRSQRELRALAGQLIGNEEEEHRLLARELHDDFSQRLTAIIYELAGLEEVYTPSVPAAFKIRLHAARVRVAGLSDDMRRLAHQLHPAAIELFGLPAALRQQCQEASCSGPCRVRFIGRLLPGSFPEDVALCLYRVTQEALRNISKHAAAKQAAVTLSGVTRGLRLSIKDDGDGFDPATTGKKSGLGLISMRERVQLIGGRLWVKSSPGKGTQVIVEVKQS